MLRSIIFIAAVALASCEKDNYDAPTAGLSGRFIDADTKALVEQDIINGTQIELKEHGYENPSSRFLVVKNDGTYMNTMLFANTYTVQPVRGNFVDVAPQDVVIGTNTVLDFNVKPYIRILDANYTRAGNLVTVTFRVQQTTANNVRKIGLYYHSDFRVGEPMRFHQAEQDINAITDPNHVYSLTLDVTQTPNSRYKPGMKYYFRVGAVVDISQAKFNYGPVKDFDF